MTASSNCKWAGTKTADGVIITALPTGEQLIAKACTVVLRLGKDDVRHLATFATEIDATTYADDLATASGGVRWAVPSGVEDDDVRYNDLWERGLEAFVADLNP